MTSDITQSQLAAAHDSMRVKAMQLNSYLHELRDCMDLVTVPHDESEPVWLWQAWLRRLGFGKPFDGPCDFDISVREEKFARVVARIQAEAIATAKDPCA